MVVALSTFKNTLNRIAIVPVGIPGNHLQPLIKLHVVSKVRPGNVADSFSEVALIKVQPLPSLPPTLKEA